MKIKAIKTKKITPGKESLRQILDRYLPKKMAERSILAITSKIVAICEGSVVPVDKIEKADLIEQEAELYLPPEENKYNITLTIRDNVLLPTAGIDESNAGGYYILWPAEPQKTANKVRSYLKKRYQLKEVGVIITDSKTTPLRRGTTGVAVCHSGFSGLNNYIGAPDIFGKKMRVTKQNVMDALAVSAVLVMGEGREQTPVAIISDLPFVQFLRGNPSKRDLTALHISIDDDLYAPMLKGVKWKKGKRK